MYSLPRGAKRDEGGSGLWNKFTSVRRVARPGVDTNFNVKSSEFSVLSILKSMEKPEFQTNDYIDTHEEMGYGEVLVKPIMRRNVFKVQNCVIRDKNNETLVRMNVFTLKDI